MIQQEHFYVTLPSNASLDEFPENQACHFKVRLPKRLEFQGQHWKVSLSSATLPDTTEGILDRLGYDDLDIPYSEKLHQAEPALFDLLKTAPVFVNKDGAFAKYVQVGVDQKDVRALANVSTNVSFMTSMFNVMSAHLNRDIDFLVHPKTKKSMFPNIYWEKKGDTVDLVWDNTNLQINEDSPMQPILYLRTDLALKMGLLLARGTHYFLGGNLVPMAIDGKVKNTFFRNSTTNEILSFLVDEKYLKLSPVFNWRFTNLNRAYDKLRGAPSRTLLVYSDVGQSSIVGGQITDLLREVPYNRKERGTMYIEPYHYHFRAIRIQVMETIEVQFSEQNGKMVKFDNKQMSSITVIFKNDV